MMQVGDKVWIVDQNHRIYKDDKGNELTSPWFRGYFVDRTILGETKVSCIVGNEWNKVNDNSNFKVNKKTLEYTIPFRGGKGILYPTETDIDKACWINDNQYKIIESMRQCHDYDKLKQIQNILAESKKGE